MPSQEEALYEEGPISPSDSVVIGLSLPALWLDWNPAAVCPDSYPTQPRRGKPVDQNYHWEKIWRRN